MERDSAKQTKLVLADSVAVENRKDERSPTFLSLVSLYRHSYHPNPAYTHTHLYCHNVLHELQHSLAFKLSIVELVQLFDCQH